MGRTEAEVGSRIEEAILAEGHTEAAFVIVGSGPHGADPHHGVAQRRIESGDVVVIDIGGPVEPGYYSDSTRTYVLGNPIPRWPPDTPNSSAHRRRRSRPSAPASRPPRWTRRRETR